MSEKHYMSVIELVNSIAGKYDDIKDYNAGRGDNCETNVSLIADYDVCVKAINCLVRYYGFDICNVEINDKIVSGYGGAYIVSLDSNGLWCQTAVYGDQEHIVYCEDDYVFVQSDYVNDFLYHNPKVPYLGFTVNSYNTTEEVDAHFDSFKKDEHCEKDVDTNADKDCEECEPVKCDTSGGFKTYNVMKLFDDGDTISISLSGENFTDEEYDHFKDVASFLLDEFVG